MAHPHHDEAKKGHAKKLESYGGKSKKTDNWAGDPDLNTSGKPAGLMPILTEPKLSQETNEKIMRKAGGKVAPKRLDKPSRSKKMDGGSMMSDRDRAIMAGATPRAMPTPVTPRARPVVVTPRAMPGPVTGARVLPSPEEAIARSGKFQPYKKGGKVHSDEAEDKALIRKMVKKEDLKRAGRAYGGRAGKDVGGPAMGKNGLTIVVNGAGGQQARPGMPPIGAMPTMPLAPPSPPVGMPPVTPVGGAPVPGGMPPGGMGGMTPPNPPTGMMAMSPTLPNQFNRKRGGRIRTTEDLTAGAGSGEGRLQKTELQKAQ